MLGFDFMLYLFILKRSIRPNVKMFALNATYFFFGSITVSVFDQMNFNLLFSSIEDPMYRSHNFSHTMCERYFTDSWITFIAHRFLDNIILSKTIHLIETISLYVIFFFFSLFFSFFWETTKGNWRRRQCYKCKPIMSWNRFETRKAKINNNTSKIIRNTNSKKVYTA